MGRGVGGDQHWEEHRNEAEMENIDFLLGIGLHRDHIARRLGMARGTLDKKIERSKRVEGQSDSSEVEERCSEEGSTPLPALRLASSNGRVAPQEE